MTDTTSEYDGKTFLITAPLVVVGAGSAATYLYRGGIIPAGFATDEQIEHHLAIDAIEEFTLPEAEEPIDPADEIVADEGKPTGEIDGRDIDGWTLADLKGLAKVEGIDLGGKTAKADVFSIIVDARAARAGQ